ncbi:hypothetical protein B0H13DRAFT_1875087 [Mycena leptocephala]|nr:hypothetical protein B0H13DRAFT_1875087 [Mycena leptocephala]
MTVYMATRGSCNQRLSRQPSREQIFVDVIRDTLRAVTVYQFNSPPTWDALRLTAMSQQYIPSWGILTRAFNTSGAVEVVVRGGKVGPVEMYEFRIYSKIKDLEVHLLRVRVGYGHHKLFCRGHGGMWSRRQYSPRVITVRNVPGRDDCLLFRPRDAQGGYICQGSKGL